MKTTTLPSLFAAALAFTGCISTKYQQTRLATLGEVPLNLTPAQSPIEMYLDTVVVTRGPGSWKREALWDEYVLSLANRGTATWRVESARLIDADGQPVIPGEDPWALESITQNWWQSIGVDAMHDIELGFGTGTSGIVTAYYANLAMLAGAWFGDSAALAVMGKGAAVAAVPLVLAGHAQTNLESKEAVATEFQRRRHALLAALPPEREARGSFFFPVTPSPQRLQLQCRSGSATRTAVIELTSLAGLHRKTKPAPAAADPNAWHIKPASVWP